MEIHRLKKKSQQGAAISAIGFLIIIAGFCFAGFKLNKLNQVIENKKERLVQLDSIYTQKELQIAENEQTIAELIDEINQLKDPAIIPKAEAKVVPGVFDSKSNPIYDFTVWITSSQYTLQQIKKVSYQFGHSSFITKNRTSEDASNGYLVSYRGWGCLTMVKILVEFNNNATETLYFNMCDNVW
jgi:cell division protein FtsX